MYSYTVNSNYVFKQIYPVPKLLQKGIDGIMLFLGFSPVSLFALGCFFCFKVFLFFCECFLLNVSFTICNIMLLFYVLWS